jgi:hypothetical protein
MTSSGERAREPEREHDDKEERSTAPPPTVPIDPQGDDPEHIPDPMPADLQRTSRADQAFEETHPMDGDAPSG